MQGPDIDGETRLIAFIGFPVGQAKSPQRLNPRLRQLGRNIAVVPLGVPPAALEGVVRALMSADNVDGFIATVPHKPRMLELVDEATQAARAVGAINVAKRLPEGRWSGDMLDGRGCVAGLRRSGHGVEGRSALLVGAGGAGSAIAHALAEAGLARLVVHDLEAARAALLVERLHTFWPVLDAAAGPPEPAGHDLVINATPVGMRPEDPLPLDADALDARQLVVDVIMRPEITPLLEAARAKGCAIQPGRHMLDGQLEAMLAFFTGSAGG